MMEASVKRAAANTNEPVCAENCDTVDSPVASSAPTPATKPTIARRPLKTSGPQPEKLKRSPMLSLTGGSGLGHGAGDDSRLGGEHDSHG